MDDVRSWRFPVACPRCLEVEGVPVEVTAQGDDGVMDIRVKCGSCANEWQMTAPPFRLLVRIKPDRRREPRESARDHYERIYREASSR